MEANIIAQIDILPTAEKKRSFVVKRPMASDNISQNESAFSIQSSFLDIVLWC